jgi:hypothetical protein
MFLKDFTMIYRCMHNIKKKKIDAIYLLLLNVSNKWSEKASKNTNVSFNLFFIFNLVLVLWIFVWFLFYLFLLAFFFNLVHHHLVSFYFCTKVGPHSFNFYLFLFIIFLIELCFHFHPLVFDFDLFLCRILSSFF